MKKYAQIIALLEEYKLKSQELEEMSQSWSGSDSHERASADPGLQYALENELEGLDAEIIEECKSIIEESDD